MARLSREQIQEILVKHSQGVKQSQIAREEDVDPSTVRYHIEIFEQTYGSTAAVYSLIKPVQRACQHPSMKCLVCGKAQDHIHRHELEEIERLRIKLDQARTILAEYNRTLE